MVQTGISSRNRKLVTVSNGEKTETFDIANLTNEGYDPSVKSGWSTDGHGKKRYDGSSFGWLLKTSKKALYD